MFYSLNPSNVQTVASTWTILANIIPVASLTSVVTLTVPTKEISNCINDSKLFRFKGTRAVIANIINTIKKEAQHELVQ